MNVKRNIDETILNHFVNVIQSAKVSEHKRRSLDEVESRVFAQYLQKLNISQKIDFNDMIPLVMRLFQQSEYWRLLALISLGISKFYLCTVISFATYSAMNSKMYPVTSLNSWPFSLTLDGFQSLGTMIRLYALSFSTAWTSLNFSRFTAGEASCPEAFLYLSLDLRILKSSVLNKVIDSRVTFLLSC